MNSAKNCANCRIALSEFASLYTCCDNKRLLCRRCRPHYCPTCKSSDWKEIKEMHCFICRKRLQSEDAFKEDICGYNYCPRCVAHTFLPHFLSKDPPIIIEMRCGHYKDKLQVQTFLSQYCINCGFKFRPSVDFQLQNGMKFCDYCFKYDDRKQFQDFFQLCLSCGQILTFKEVEHCKDFPLCRQCSANQTLIEQSIVRSNAKETKPTSVISQLKSQKMKPYNGEIEEEQPSEELSIVSRFSAFEIDQSQGKKKGKLASMKALSKNSVQIRVENYKLPSVIKESKNTLIKCYLCSSLIQEDGTLTNTTHSNNKICKMCYAQTFDKSFLSYTRYNNYFQGDLRTNSVSKQPSTTNQMKSSMLPPQTTPQQSSISNQTHLLNSLLKHSAPSKVEKKQAWELEVQSKNLCEICKAKQAMITRLDKKRVCVQCKNKYG